VITASIMLAFAAGLSCGFTLGRFFERWEFIRKGYRLPRRGEEEDHE
jgi:hypothetical protein